MWLLDKFLTKVIRQGRLTITDHDGKTYDYGPGGGQTIAIRLTDRRAAGHIARYPQVGAGEAEPRACRAPEPDHELRVVNPKGNA